MDEVSVLPWKYVIRKFIMVRRVMDYRRVTRNGSASCIPPMRGVWLTEPWRGDWAARAWIIGRSRLGSWYRGSTMLTRVLRLSLFDGFVPSCDVIGSRLGPTGLSGLGLNPGIAEQLPGN